MSIATIFSYTIIYTLCMHAPLCLTLCDSMDCILPGLSGHEILQARILVSASEVAQSCPTLCNPMDCSLPGSSIHGIFQARILEWVAISFSRGSSHPGDRTQVSHIAGRCFTVWASREALNQVVISLSRVIFLTQGLNPYLLHILVWQTLWQTLYQFITKILVL